MRNKFLGLAMVSLFCLMIGYSVGYGLPGHDPTIVPPAPGTNTPVLAPAAPNGQVVILLVGVDDRTKSKPTLEFCWVITFQAGNAEYYLLGFPLDIWVEGGQSLNDYYRYGHSLEEGAALVKEAVVTLNQGNLNPQYVIIADRRLVSGIVDDLGGIMFEKNNISSQTLFAFYDNIPDTDYRLRAEAQRIALQAIVEAFRGRPWSEASLREFMRRFQAYSADADLLAQLAVQGLSLSYTEAEFQIRISPTSAPTPTP